jgi:hypothetical protein
MYPNHNKCFDIYCLASDSQLVSAILPAAFYLCKLNAAQRKLSSTLHSVWIVSVCIVVVAWTFGQVLHSCIFLTYSTPPPTTKGTTIVKAFKLSPSACIHIPKGDHELLSIVAPLKRVLSNIIQLLKHLYFYQLQE